MKLAPMGHRAALLLLALAAAAAGARAPAEEKAPDAKKASKMKAVGKAIAMLEELQSHVEEEGEAEAISYNKFACFCKDMTAEKKEAIADGEDAKKSLTAEIGKKQSKREELDSKLGSLAKEITAVEKEMKEKAAARAKERKDYEANEADLTEAVEALQAAIQVLKAAKKPSLAQLRAVARTVEAATLMADAMGLTSDADKRTLAFLQDEAPEVPTEDYTFHSDSIIETLEKLLKDFRKQKADVESAEVEAQAAYDKVLQEKTELKKKKEQELADSEKAANDVQAEIATAYESLTAAEAELLDDQQYMARLTEICMGKGATWDQRSQCRADELSAVAAAIKVLKGLADDSKKESGATVKLVQEGLALRFAGRVARDENSMEAIEEETEEDAAPTFLQLLRPRSAAGRLSAAAAAHGETGARQLVISMLRGDGRQLGSPLLSALAERIEKDRFAKVKKLIEELIERLLKESTQEATQKGWCDKSIADAEGKRDRAADSIKELNTGMERAEAERDALVEELEKLKAEIKELEDAKAKAEKTREEEKAQNTEDIADAKVGMEAIAEAIKNLEEFYAKAAKAKVKELLQKGPDEDVPDAGFEDGEVYKGATGKAEGVIGLLEVVRSDFERTVTLTEKAEAEAAQDFQEFMRTTKKSLAAKKTVQTNKTKMKDDLVEKLTTDGEQLDSEAAQLEQAIKELLELKKACFDQGMSYEERVARRQEEIEALKKASCVLDNYEKYGPDAAGDAC